MVWVTARVKHEQSDAPCVAPPLLRDTGQLVPGQPAVPPCISCRAHITGAGCETRCSWTHAAAGQRLNGDTAAHCASVPRIRHKHCLCNSLCAAVLAGMIAVAVDKVHTTLLSLSHCTSAACLSNVSLQVNLQEKLRRLRVAGKDASRVTITVPPSLRRIKTFLKTGSLTLQEGIVYEVRSGCTEGQGSGNKTLHHLD